MSKTFIGGRFSGEREIAQLRRIADFLITEADRQEAELEVKHQEYLKMPDGGEEFHGATQKEALSDHLGDEYDDMTQFQQVMYRSFVLGIFSYIENDLHDFCNRLQDIFSQKFSVKDLKNTGIGSSLHYIDRVIGQKFMADDGDIRSFNRLRNYFAHGDIRITKEKQADISKYIKDTSFDIKFRNDEFFIGKETLYKYIDFAGRVEKTITEMWLIDPELSDSIDKKLK